MSGLTLEIKKDETFVLFDEKSQTTTRIKVAPRDRGGFAAKFNCPASVRITREKD